MPLHKPKILTDPCKISPTGFREYDARWRFPQDIDLPGLTRVGLGIGTQMHRMSAGRDIVLGHDYRHASPAVAAAISKGLVAAGIQVHDIGLCLSPTAYFARRFLDVPAVAMITASHNPWGWTGVKLGFDAPLTHGPAEMAELRDIVLNDQPKLRDGGAVRQITGIRDAYIDDLTQGPRLTHPLRIVCACGNGTAGAFAPAVLSRLGAEVIPLHCRLDHSFPHYVPNPEALVMLDDMADAVLHHGADMALGFDGDGDRCGIVDDTGQEVPADRMGVILARAWARTNPGAHFIADVKSTGLFRSDPVLRALGATVEYWKTGHSHMKARVQDTGALAGFEKSGHYTLAAHLGYGYDCALRAAVEICRLLDRHRPLPLSRINATLPRVFTSPTMSPACPDELKYDTVDRITADLQRHAARSGTMGGQPIIGITTLNGARVELANGGWGLVRASSNTPNLVVVCESPESHTALQAIVTDLDRIIRAQPHIGPYDQHVISPVSLAVAN